LVFDALDAEAVAGLAAVIDKMLVRVDEVADAKTSTIPPEHPS